MPRDILGRRTKSSFLAASMDQRLQADAISHIQRAHSFRAVELMCRERQQIDRRGIHVKRDFAGALDRVGVKDCACLMGNVRQFIDSLHRSHHVVR